MRKSSTPASLKVAGRRHPPCRRRQRSGTSRKASSTCCKAARQVLKNWAMNKLRADIILSLGAITADGDVQISYAAATAAQRNTWLVNNCRPRAVRGTKANAVPASMRPR